MKTPIGIFTASVCLLSLLAVAPAVPAQAPGAAEKLQMLSQELKLTPEQKGELLPILQAEAPKFEAIKNNASMPPMQKMRELRAIHSENSGPLQKILSPAQYQKLQAIREADIKKAVAAKRAAR